jgi:hypothetical protein
VCHACYPIDGTLWVVIIDPSGTVILNDFHIDIGKLINFLKTQAAECMANKKKKTKQSHSQKNKIINWKEALQKSAFYIVLLTLIVGTVLIYSHNNMVKYDLSVIGNGSATVVQIHDHNCQLCRQLKSNLDSVKSDFKENIQFKTANILAKKGADFARQYQVAHVTLLFFNKQGQRVNTLQGVSSKDEIRRALQQLVKQR